MGADLERIRGIANRIASSSGLEVVEVDLRGGKQRLLRVFIEKDEAGRRAMRQSLEGRPDLDGVDQLAGVTHEDCANFSRELDTILEVEDAMSGGSYLLEVSSPGLDRKLSRPEDFLRFQGSLVKLTTREPVQGNRHWQGRLREFSLNRLRLETVSGVGKNGKKLSHKKRAELQRSEVEIEFINIEKANLVPEV